MTFVLAHEGGYVNDLDDPGGETKYGISKRAHPDLDIKNLTVERAKEIFYNEYWIPSGGDMLPSPLDIVVMDTAVNCGVSRAVEWLKTSHRPEDYLFRRLAHYSELAKSRGSKYLRGWVNRVVDLWNFIKPMTA